MSSCEVKSVDASRRLVDTVSFLIIPRRKFQFSWCFVLLRNSEFFAISSAKPNLKRLRPDTHHIGGVDLHNVRERLSGLMNPLDANNTLRSWWQTQMFQQVFFHSRGRGKQLKYMELQ